MRTATHAPGALVSFSVAVTRAVAVLAVLGALSAAYLLALGADGVRPRLPAADSSAGQEVWKESYSRRFPGCVAALLWTPGEAPRAVVMRDHRGTLREMSVREAAVRVRDGGVGPLSTVGVCR